MRLKTGCKFQRLRGANMRMFLIAMRDEGFKVGK
jgi:hypothetical protein